MCSILFCPLETQYELDHHVLFPGTVGLLTRKEYEGTLPKGAFKAKSPCQSWLLPVTDESVPWAGLWKTTSEHRAGEPHHRQDLRSTPRPDQRPGRCCGIPGSPASQGHVRFYFICYHLVWDIYKIVIYLESIGASLVGTWKESASPGAEESCFILLKVLLQW